MNQTGLSSKQVQEKIAQGKVNLATNKKSNSIGRIIARNTLTIFNLVNIILAVMVFLVGSYKNMLFILIAIANTLIAIINEVRARRTINKMRLLVEQKPTVIRDGKPRQILPEQIVEGDLIIFGLGDQILVDSRLEEGTIEVNESFITGEQDSITKNRGDKLTSGSFVVSGTCKATVTAVGPANYINKLEASAHIIKTDQSELFRVMNNIVKYISFVLLPIGALMLWSRLRVSGGDTTTAVTSTVASLINMIPEGLVLLTSSVLALATIRLSRKKVLVQDLYSVETLARVDTIALDKTGTLTTGKMTVHDYTALNKSFETALASILSHQTTENATITALKQKFIRSAKNEEIEGITETIDFSSERKHSGVVTSTATYLLGAVEFITDNEEIIKKVESASKGYRTLAVVKKISKDAGNSLSKGVRSAASREVAPAARADEPAERAPREAISASSSDMLLGFIRLEDEIRPDAKSIIKYFYDNDIAVKIISGDDLEAVTKIASRVGVRDLNGINLPDSKSPDYAKLVKDYSIFTRVTPTQKKRLIEALKKQGSTVAMTGDGVNDILAMKESDVSIAIGEGSDAARRSAKLVLLNSGFESVPSIIDEGRQSINNLERSTALFLAKTVYASILAVIFIILPIKYPFSSPVEMSLLNFACIGFPGLVLALEHNTERIKNRFTRNILEYSVPVGLTISISMLTLSILAHFNIFPHYDLATTAVFVTFTIDLILIYWISKPLNALRAGLLLTIIVIFIAAFLVPIAHDFFDFVFLTPNGLIATLIAIASSILLFEILRLIMKKISSNIFDRSNF